MDDKLCIIKYNEIPQDELYVDENFHDKMKEGGVVTLTYQVNGIKIITNESGNKLYSINTAIKINDTRNL